MKTFSDIFITDHIKLTTRASANRFDCFRQAAILALTEWERVVFEHNGTTYTVDPGRIVAQLEEFHNP